MPNTLVIVLAVLGVLCLITEMCIPGFGFFGISGTVLLLVSILFTARTVLQGILMSAILLVIVGGLLAILLRSAKRGRLSRTLVLHSAIQEEAAQAADSAVAPGIEGVAKTSLRPVGTAELDGKRLDVQTEGEFLQPGTPIVVTKVQGNKIIVKENTKE